MQDQGFLHAGAILRCGVYALMWKGQVVYVGQSRSVLERVYTHRNLYKRNRKAVYASGPFPKGKPIQFDDIWVLPCDYTELDRIERELIAKYTPKYNTQHQPKGTPKHKREFQLVIGGVAVTLNGQEAPLPRRQLPPEPMKRRVLA